jgi:lipoprotein-releasing system permease protein
LSVSWFIARRYLQSQRRSRFLSFITLFAVIGIMLGTAALILTLTILAGFEHEIKTKVIEFASHIEVLGFQNLPLKDPALAERRVREKVGGIKAMGAFAAKEGMIRSREAVDGIYLKGVDEAAQSAIPRHRLVAGTFFGAADTAKHPIVLGKRLADRLNVGLGEKVVVFALPSGSGAKAKAMQFAVTGIYESGMAEFDDIYAYTKLPLAQNLFQLGDDVTGYDIMVDDVGRIDSAARQIQEVLDYPHFARTVFQRYHGLFSWVELQKKLSPVLLSLIMVVAVVNIIGTLLMFALEKTREIGILKSIGAGPAVIRRIFILQGLGISCAGILLGNALAWGLAFTQSRFHLFSLPSEIYYMASVPILLNPLNFLLVSAAALVLSMLAVLLPARAIAALDPVTALRFG